MGEDAALEMLFKKLDVDGKRKELFGTPPQIVWHYTDAAGATGILSGHTLRATHAAFLNDPGEIRRGREEAIAVVDEELHDCEEGNNLDQWAKQLRERLDPAAEDDTYLCCMSAKGDDLNQWRSYGDDGRGYAIGFRTGGTTGMSDLHLLRAVYDLDTFKQRVRSVVEVAKRELASPQSPFLTSRALSGWITALAMSLKDACYEPEDEWRIAYGAVGPEDALQFRTSSRWGVVPYRTFELQNRHGHDIEPPPIHAVRLGPRLRGGPARRALGLLCESTGLIDIDIVDSKLPYRG